MAGETRSEFRHWLRNLRSRPGSFDFFEVVRRLEQQATRQPRLGKARRPGDEPIRFGQEPSLSFESSPISAYQANSRGGVPRLLVHFFGLLGPDGPLPLHLTEYVRDRQRKQGDPTMARFLDLFHHRMLCLFYRAWALNEQAVSFDRSDDDWMSRYIGNLIGLGRPGVSNRDVIPDAAKLYFSGRLISAARNTEGLAAILSGYLHVPVSIQPFVGRQFSLPEMNRCYLGKQPAAGCLGESVLVGSTQWTRSDAFRIRLGAVGLHDYHRLLPGQPLYEVLQTWVKNYLTQPLRWQVQWVLKASQVPNTRLGQYGQLGRTCWLKSKSFSFDAEDLVVDSDGVINV